MKKFIKNKVGASMMDFFIISTVTIIIGGGIFVMGSVVNDGIDIGTDNVTNLNNALRRQEGTPDGP